MPIKAPETDISQYTSSVPIVQQPQLDLSGNAPAGPLPGQFGGHKGSGGLAIGDAILKGFIKGHEFKAQKKASEAQATITAANAASESTYQKYQDALSKAGGDVNNPDAKAAYDAYLGVFNKGKEAMSQFAIPEKGQKGQKGKDGKKGGMMTSIHDFFDANPHLVPQIALMTMQPKAPGQSRETQLQDLQMKEAAQSVEAGKQNLEIGKQNISLNDQNIAANREKEQNAKLERQVEEKGGVDAVLGSKDSSPDLKMAANRIKYSALDAQSPEGKLKMQFYQDALSGKSKNWTPEQRVLAAEFGAAPKPELQTITAKNGHQQQILVDPSTNQPIAGSKPLDLGPPQWAQEFYAKQSYDKRELQKAVSGDPTAWGVRVTGDPKADKAALDAKVSELYVKASFGISSLASQFGKTGYEVQRDNEQLQTLMKELGLDGSKKNSPLDSNPPTLTYPDGKTTAVGSGYMAAMLHQFVTKPSENAGVMAYRDTPQNPDGKSPEVLDAERKFLFQYVKNHLMTQKGKLAMTDAQADAFLKTTALGRPVTAPAGGLGAPPQAPPQSSQGMPAPPQAGRGIHLGAFGVPTFGAPPQVGQQAQAGQQPQAGAQSEVKLYMIPGANGPVQLSSDDLAKLKANNIPVEELSSDLMNQFLGR